MLPPSFELPTLEQAQLVLPQQLKAGAERMRIVKAIGRLSPEATPESARAALTPFYEAFLESVPADLRKTSSISFRVQSVQERQTQDYRLASWMLLGAVLAVMLIACANVAGLLLARSATTRT